jgi:hypothetical protein
MNDLDKPRAIVRVRCLETGDEYAYSGMSARRALVLAYVQGFLGDFKSWEYDEREREHGPDVVVGPTGKVATLQKGQFTYSTVIN